MKLIVGLGNPGKEYERTRHNMGFISLDMFAEMAGIDFDREGFKGVYGICKDPRFPEPFILLKPTTFMNLSGESVQAIASYFKIELEDIVVVYDDMALLPGQIRMRPGGSSGGHNGIKNIALLLGSEKIKRIRVGIGEPSHAGIDHVLEKIKDDETWNRLLDGCKKASLAIKDIVLHSFEYSMNIHNREN